MRIIFLLIVLAAFHLSASAEGVARRGKPSLVMPGTRGMSAFEANEELIRLKFSSCEPFLSQTEFFRVDDTPDMDFAGFTEVGYAEILEAARALRVTTERFHGLFEVMESWLDTKLIARIAGQNSLDSSRHGAAKSSAIAWLFPGIWNLQVNQWTTLAALVGDRTEEALKAGTMNINPRGTILEAVVANIDEIGNANPLFLSSILSLMNPGERYVAVGKEYNLHAYQLAFINSTSNANRYQMLKSFLEMGLQSGPALQNRILYKTNLYNWLPRAAQERRDKLFQRINHLKSIATGGEHHRREDARAALRMLLPEPINYTALHHFAEQAFGISRNLEAGIRDLANELFIEYNKQIKQSESAHKSTPLLKPEIMTPSIDWSERVRTEMIRTIKISAALDALRYLEVDEIFSPGKLKKKIMLGPLSIWRAFFMCIDVPPGRTYFDLGTLKMKYMHYRPRNIDAGYQYLFGQKTATRNDKFLFTTDFLIRNDLEQQEFDDMQSLQTVFATAIESSLAEQQITAKEVAEAMRQNPFRAQINGQHDFEFLLYRTMAPKLGLEGPVRPLDF